ncbi:glycoside hydrolase family 15 protein [Aquidulcibacter sp.]|uniref:glycoside hydrolase family 15 protein n=1 Tax=Aquidulcibacter sp. TaxID=2052990 RepID=UPI0025C44714|nr:glycoside hydrolase family 15 protein [Aquidulcibacter sp.]MCA3693066.1 glycosyl hydrolase family 15 [Aquidulcibacter sp.]
MNDQAPDMEARLSHWYDHIDAIFLKRLSAEAGLLPASTAKTVHGDYAHAWVRDNVYSILGVWGLACAYKRLEPGSERTHFLEANVIRLMRGLLSAMMGQADKVERFKHTQDPLDGLHAKYDAATGKPVVGDAHWGHLQIDATSLFLLFLAQMTAGGLKILKTADEVDFVQNLVHYIGPAYRIADYGIWERGRKSNDGVVEINASSVGVAKAALEAMDGLDFGCQARGPIRVPADDIARARETLQVLLPGESASKETDAALLAVVGWPAFAVDDKVMIAHTRGRILDRLAGRYGCKRFLRDGHQTTVEDEHRLHYHAGELSKFANIESEWPLFFTYLLVDAEMTGDKRGAGAWADRLDPLFQIRDGLPLLPELYYVEADAVEAEAAAPGSQDRVANANLPLLWAQSLWALGAMLQEGLLAPEDIDPLGRRHHLNRTHQPEIAFAIVAEDEETAAKLSDLGLICDRMAELGSEVTIRPAGDLVSVWTQIGSNADLGLTGRPEKRLGPLANAYIYEAEGQPVVFSATLLEAHDHHIRYDAAARARRLRGDLRYVARHWRGQDNPVFILCVDATAMQGTGVDRLIELLHEVQRGQVDFARTKLMRMDDVLRAQAKSRSIGSLLRHETKTELKPSLPQSIDQGFGPSLDQAIASGDQAEVERIYEAAGRAGDWATARRGAASLNRTDPRLQDSAKDIVVRLRRLGLGEGRVITRPVSEGELVTMIEDGLHSKLHAVIAQEVLQALGLFSKSDSNAVRGMRTIRLTEIVGRLGQEEAGGMDNLVAEPPSILFDRVKSILLETPSVRAVVSPAPAFALTPSAQAIGNDWEQWRERLGILTRVGNDFFARLWSLLHVCPGIVFGANNRLDAAVARSDLTAWEKDFALEIEVRLETIPDPAYRTFCLEALNVLANRHERDPDYRVEQDIILDDLIHDAVAWIWRQAGHGEPDWTEAGPVWAMARHADAQTMALALYACCEKYKATSEPAFC